MYIICAQGRHKNYYEKYEPHVMGGGYPHISGSQLIFYNIFLLRHFPEETPPPHKKKKR